MKKIILALLFSLPLMAFSQVQEDAKFGRSDDRQERGAANSEDAGAMRQQQEQQNQKELIREMRKMNQEAESYYYMEVVVTFNDNEESVSLNMDQSLLASVKDPVTKRRMEEIAKEKYESLVSALNSLNGMGWQYLDSFTLGMGKEGYSVVKVILRKPQPAEARARR